MIAFPKLIHQIWLGPKDPPWHMMATWAALNPGWTYRLWREADLPPITNRPQFDNGSYSLKSDVARWELLVRHGGLYVDTDAACLRPIDEFLPQVRRSFWVAYDIYFKKMLAATPICCTPLHPVAYEMIRQIGRLVITKTSHIGPTRLITAVADMPAYRGLVQRFGWETWEQPLDYVGTDAFGIHAGYSHEDRREQIYAWRPRDALLSRP